MTSRTIYEDAMWLPAVALVERVQMNIQHIARGCLSASSHQPAVYVAGAIAALTELAERLEAHEVFLAHVSDWRLDKAIELVRSDLPVEGVMRERLLGRLLNIRDHAEGL